MDGICSILQKLNINHTTFFDKNYYKKRNKSYPIYRVNVHGLKNISNWFQKVGFSNQRHRNKWQVYINERAGEDLNPGPIANSLE